MTSNRRIKLLDVARDAGVDVLRTLALLRREQQPEALLVRVERLLQVTDGDLVRDVHQVDDAAPVRRAPVRRVEGPTLPPLPSTVADADAGMPAFGETPLPAVRSDFGSGPMQGGIEPMPPRPSVPGIATP